MSNRRNKPPNRVGCKPDEDVCVQHDSPLVCRHGCEYAKLHPCKAYYENKPGAETPNKESES